jgi:hypothetical protein
VHRWQAWLLFFGSFGAKSPSTIFLASLANTRQKKSAQFFFGEKAGQILGVNNSPITKSYSGYTVFPGIAIPFSPLIIYLFIRAG